MKKLKLSPFWLVMIGVAAVLLFGLLPVVLNQKAKEDALRGQLKRKAADLAAARDDTPSRSDIEAWTKYRSDITKAYVDVTNFYTQSDKVLERWFPNLLLGADGDPARDTFMTRYLDEGKQLEDKLSAKPYEVKIISEDPNGGKPRSGFNWEPMTPADWAQVAASGATDEKMVLRELQKRFWARQRLANAIINGGVKVNRIVDFRFFKRLHDKLSGSPWEQWKNTPEDTIHWQGVNAGPNGQPAGFAETDLPNELGKTLTFGCALELPYSEVPKAIREMLNPGNEAGAQERMLVNLIGTHVTIRDQNEPSITFTYYTNKPGDEATKKAAALAKAGGEKPHPVLLAITLQIVDFDPTKVKKFEAK
jgi:hypothetical protein